MEASFAILRGEFSRTCRRSLAALVVLLTSFAGGCGPTGDPGAGVTERAPNDAPALDRPSDANRDAAKQENPAEGEKWDVLYIDRAKVGYGYSKTEVLREDGRDIVQTTARHALEIRRYDQLMKQEITLRSWELPSGQLLRFESEVSDNGPQRTTRGQYASGQLRIETNTLGKSSVESITWDPSWGGFFAAEQGLLRKPMQPGDTRAFRSLIPDLNQIGQVQLIAGDYESTELLSATQELLRIDSVIRAAGTVIKSVHWTNREGETLKSLIPALNLVTYRTSKDVAVRKDDETGSFDLGFDTVVPVDRVLSEAHATKHAVYEATLQEADPAQRFAQGASQRVRRIRVKSAEIVVRALRPDTPLEGFPTDDPPTDADRLPNNFIQSDDPRIVTLAGGVLPEETDAWTLACGLERFVSDYVQNKGFSQALATAADVARSREGDCTEHAVLLAALCRARKLPARIVIGLVYFEPVGGFSYHMWNEVWTGDRWVPMDGTLGKGGIGAAHLKLLHAPLDGTSPLGAFLPVVEVLGQLELKVVSIGEPK